MKTGQLWGSKVIFPLPLVLFLVFLFSCAPSRFVRPLKKGERAVNANVGGPVVKLAGAVFPLPLSGVTYGNGLSDDFTLFGTLHFTSLAFGVYQTELGGVYRFYSPGKGLAPGLSVSPVANIAVDHWRGNFKFWPQVDANAYWEYGKQNSFFYAGLSNWVELASYKAHQEKQMARWVWSPQVGHYFCSGKWDYGVEVKWLAPSYSNKEIVVNYAQPFGNKGALGLYLTLNRKF